MRKAMTLAALALMLSGCGGPLPPVAPGGKVLPCGVITDSLADVQGKTREDDRRISNHAERGHRAGCW